ncbi:cbb3-type cytochrome oxidase assembly protein CcoS [Mesorhizobium sp. 128a]
MATLVYLIPVALCLGGLGLFGFLWALKSGQYEDLDGAAERILIDRDDKPGGLTGYSSDLRVRNG